MFSRGLFTKRGMKMKFLITIFMTLFAFTASAYVVPTYRDLKPASQQMIEKQSIVNPVVANSTRLKSAQATTSSATTTISTFSAQPDVPRALTVTTGGTTTDCNAGNVVVSGTNIFGKAITESLAITENQAGATAGTKAFKTVTSVLIPIQDGNGCTYDVGVGDQLGLKACLENAGHVIQAVFNGAYEATRPTCVADADEVEKNTCDINGTLDGAKTVQLFFMQNFACKP